jgi:HAD superfamily hydrolase (TIGR01509 family)
VANETERLLSRSAPKAVLFDLYETLISEYADGKRKSLRDGSALERLGIPAEAWRKHWGERWQRRMDGTFPDFPSVVRDIAAALELHIGEEAIETYHRHRIAEKALAFRDISGEIMELLTKLRKRGVKLGLVSNCAPEEVTAWPDCPLVPLFDTVLLSYEVRLAKPDARIYELACSRLGIEPGEALFVGDGGSDELYGARRCGLTAYHAVWFIPESMKGRFPDVPKLTEPAELLELVTVGEDCN